MISTSKAVVVFGVTLLLCTAVLSGVFSSTSNASGSSSTSSSSRESSSSLPVVEGAAETTTTPRAIATVKVAAAAQTENKDDNPPELPHLAPAQVQQQLPEEFQQFQRLMRTKNKKGVDIGQLEQQLLRMINPLNASGDTRWDGGGGICPFFRMRAGRDADSKVNQDVVSKYSRYTKDYCNTTGFLQMNFKLFHFLGFVETIAAIVRLRPGMRVFDLGSGCGTLLNYLSMKYNTVGVGVDITFDAVHHARLHARPNQTFCHTDATLLRHFPPNSFDAIVSWAMLYHVRRTWVQCSIVRELCRMMKPGTVGWLGQLRTEKTQLFWRKGKCQLEGCSWRRLQDANTFRIKSFRKHGFFSIYLVKHANNSNSTDIMSMNVDNVVATGGES